MPMSAAELRETGSMARTMTGLLLPAWFSAKTIRRPPLFLVPGGRRYAAQFGPFKADDGSDCLRGARAQAEAPLRDELST